MTVARHPAVHGPGHVPDARGQQHAPGDRPRKPDVTQMPTHCDRTADMAPVPFDELHRLGALLRADPEGSDVDRLPRHDRNTALGDPTEPTRPLATEPALTVEEEDRRGDRRRRVGHASDQPE